AAVEGAGGARAEAVEAVGAQGEALFGERADAGGGSVALADLEALLAPFGAQRQAQRPLAEAHVEIAAEVDVDALFGLGIAAGAEAQVGRLVRAKRGVDRVVDQELDVVAAVAGAEVPVPGAPCTLGPGHHRVVLQLATEARGEASRQRLQEGEAVA